MVVAQTVAWLLPTPEDPGSNPAISNFQNIFPMVIIRKDESKQKAAWNGPFKNRSNRSCLELTCTKPDG